jgi:hypothetical protein
MKNDFQSLLSFRISKIHVSVETSKDAIIASAKDLWSTLEVIIPNHVQSEVNTKFLLEFLHECVESLSQDNWVNDAKFDSESFVDRDNVPAKFLADFVRHGRNFEPMIKEIQEQNDPFEFNSASCIRAFSDVSSIPAVLFDTVLEIATHGSKIFVPDNFIPNHVPLPRRSLDISLGKTNLKQAYKLCEKKKAMIFNLSDLTLIDLEKLSFQSQLHNVAKANDVGSRMCFDASNTPDGVFPLNHPSAREKSILVYPSETLPTLRSLTQSMLNLVDKAGKGLSEYSACVRDYKGAFATTKLEPESACLTAVMVSDDIVMVQFYGCFGLQDQSHVWGKIIEATDLKIREVTKGVHVTYVDDVCQFSHDDDIHEDDRIGLQIATDIHNKSPFDEDKNDLFTKFPVLIGWSFNFIKGVFKPNKKGIMKLFLTFFCLVDITPNSVWSIKLIQIVQSLAERYSHGIIGMRPFVDAFSDLLRGVNLSPDNSRNIHFLKGKRPSAAAKYAIIIWRAVILGLILQPDFFEVPMRSLMDLDKLPSLVFGISDAGPKGIGLVVYNPAGVVIAFADYWFQFNAEDPSYQNSRELIGLIIFYIVVHIKLNLPRGTSIPCRWATDSRSCVAWIEQEKSKSSRAQKIFYAINWISIVTGIVVNDIKHVAGTSEEMRISDGLSRGYDELSAHLDSSLKINLSAMIGVNELMRLIDPTIIDADVESHASAFQQISRVIKKVFASKHSMQLV